MDPNIFGFAGAAPPPARPQTGGAAPGDTSVSANGAALSATGQGGPFFFQQQPSGAPTPPPTMGAGPGGAEQILPPEISSANGLGLDTSKLSPTGSQTIAPHPTTPSRFPLADIGSLMGNQNVDVNPPAAPAAAAPAFSNPIEQAQFNAVKAHNPSITPEQYKATFGDIPIFAGRPSPY